MPSPFLRTITTDSSRYRPGEFPFTLPLIQRGFSLRLTAPVTFLVGENGSGKSTLLEGIADKCGFLPHGGSRNSRAAYDDYWTLLAPALRLDWKPKVNAGFFLRAESFFDFAGDLDRNNPDLLRYFGGKSLHSMSHGESFLTLINSRTSTGLYLFDEPEAALSPMRQLTLLRAIQVLVEDTESQFLIATHSPILMAYPGAVILSLDGEEIRPVAWRDTEHYQVTRSFLENPERYLRHLMAPED